jgi:hypothetical protein
MAERKESDEAVAISCYLRRTRLYLEIKKDLRVIISLLAIFVNFLEATSLVTKK